MVDTLELARQKFPGSQNSLDALCKRFNIDNSKAGKTQCAYGLSVAQRNLYKFARSKRTQTKF